MVTKRKDGKTVVFGFGRFQPITAGHGLVADKIADEARKYNGDGLLFTSQVEDSKKNPIPYNDKIKFLQEAFPKITVVKNKQIKTAFEAADYLASQGYDRMIFIVGGDRIDEFAKSLEKFVTKTFKNVTYFTAKNAGRRDNSSGLSGISGTKVREYAIDGNWEEFNKATPATMSKASKRKMYLIIRAKLGNHQKEEIEFFDVWSGTRGKILSRSGDTMKIYVTESMIYPERSIVRFDFI